MQPDNQAEPLPINTIVRIREFGSGRCRIVEYRGSLVPKGARVYRRGGPKDSEIPQTHPPEAPTKNVPR